MLRPLLLVSLLGISGAMTCEETRASGPIAKARPGDVAIMEELTAARAAGTAEAYRLFIRRHPRHRLADIARAELAKIERHHRH